MRKIKQLCLLVLAIFLLLPSAAWAADVPEVTEDEYRFFLEYYAGFYYLETDFSKYSDHELHQMITDAVAEKESMYVDFADLLEFELWDDYMFEESEMGKYTEAELEKFMARALADEEYSLTVDYLQEIHHVKVNLPCTPQEIQKIYYQTLLKEEYGVTKDLSGYEWYVLDGMYQRYYLTEELQQKYKVSKDVSNYTLEELYKLDEWYHVEAILREAYGETKDLSNYTLEELQALVDWHNEINFLQDTYGNTDDLSQYTMKELYEIGEWYNTVQLLRERGVKEDLTGKTLQEVKDLWVNTIKTQQAQQDILIEINGEYIRFIDSVDDVWMKEEYPYTSDTRPIMQDNRVYIPFRAVFEALGADVSYNASAKTVTAKRDSTTVSFTVGEAQYSKNGVTQQMDANVFVQDGRTFVPVRFAAQALGATVEWDSENRTVVITERK